MQRSAVSPGMARQLMDMICADRSAGDPSHDPVPTLVTHQRDDRYVPVELGREVASLIPGARFIEYPGDDSYGWARRPALDEVEEFLTGGRRHAEVDRVLATVMFTDIVGSTEHALAARRRALAGRCSTSTTRSSRRADALARARGQDDRRRLPRHLRRSGARGSLRRGDRRRGPARSASTCAPACTRASAS